MNDGLDPITPLGAEAGDSRPSAPPVRNRAWLRATAVAAIVGAGGLGSWALAQPTSSGAQTSDSTVAEDSASDAPGGHFGRGRGGEHLTVVAEALGLTEDEVMTALRDGTTLAELAEAEGVDVDTLITKLVAAAITDIDEHVASGDLDADRAEEIKADLTERITAMVNGEGRGFRGPGGGMGGPGGHHGGRGGHGPGLDTAAEVLGLDVDDLRSQLQDGQTLAEVAGEQGVDVDTLIDALVDEARDRITDMVNGVAPERPADDSTDSTDSTDSSAVEEASLTA